MPDFDYRCADCQHVFTIKIGFNNKATVLCPLCGADKTQRIFTSLFFGGKQKTARDCKTPSPTRFT